ncbi:OmpA family protein [Microbulbifer aestuariivivens]|uniref:OmpA family protein n=1 Tax=Microbulbifer aestuariivivens TaxID=1908308 RepID=UPI0031E9885B
MSAPAHVWLPLVFLFFSLISLFAPSAAQAQNQSQPTEPSITNTARASWFYPGSPGIPVQKDSNALTLPLLQVPACTPSTAFFYQQVPAAQSLADARERAFEGGAYAPNADPDAANAPLPPPSALDGSALSLAALATVPATVYHAGEPILLTLEDANRNLDPAIRELVQVSLASAYGDGANNPSSAAPDREILYLRETGADTGIFSAAIQSRLADGQYTPRDGDGQLVLGINARLQFDYGDPMCDGESAQTAILVDPLGVVFDSVDGTPLAGATVSLVRAADGSAAPVFADDGVTPISNVQQTGANGMVGFRFPFVPPGDYRLLVTPPAGYSAPSTVADADMPPAPDGSPYQVVPASRGQVFTLVPGPVLVVDIPVDPGNSGLLLEKSVSESSAAIGDFLQYRLQLENLTAREATQGRISDTLPAGMRYREGSLAIDGVRRADPAISADGRVLEIPLDPLAPAGQVEVRYVVEVAAGTANGEAVNRASASAQGPGGRPLNSNLAQATVNIRQPFISDRFTLVGSVLGGDCDTPAAERQGIAGVRVLLEDGSHVVTDSDGRYHFQGVRPGTHVVQLDIDHLPDGWQPVSCVDNTRSAGSSYSRFVDARGGSLWRVDFQLRPGEAGLRLQTETTAASPLIEPVAPRNFTFRGRFASGDDQLLPESLAELQALLRELQTGEVLTLQAVGHTDSQRLSARAAAKFQDNYGLAMARAATIADALGAALGLSAERITVGGMGPDQPLASNDSAAGMATNRRVEVTVYGRTGPPTEVVGKRLQLRHQLRLDTSVGDFSNLRITAMLPGGLRYLPGTAQLDGVAVADPRQMDNMLLWRLPDTVASGNEDRDERFTRHFTFQTESLQRRDDTAAATCAQDTSLKVNALVDTPLGKNLRLPLAENRLGCPTDALLPGDADHNGGGSSPAGTGQQGGAEQGAREPGVATTTLDSGRLAVALTATGNGKGARAPGAETGDSSEPAKASSISAAGGDVNWLARARGQSGLLFPPEKHNPRAPAVRAVIAHGVGEKVELSINGEPAPALSFDGVETAASGNSAISKWRALPLEEGDNLLEARVLDDGGRELARYSRNVHYANTPARAVLVEEQSRLVADGVSRPQIAVRILDRDGYPVRDGITGTLGISAPYETWQSNDDRQQRQLAGMEALRPQYLVQGDEGIARIELAPTTNSGAFTLDFRFRTGTDSVRTQQLQGWMAPAAREWVVVGFAEGTLGYNTLEQNMQPLAAGDEEGVYTDGQISFYAKGRVLGRWLLTMAYDSDKTREEGLLSPIDPSRYYTLYGDGTTPVYGAPSRDKLYVKMERGQFYALFGDYETGLVNTQLSRYSRALNGFKAENGAGPLVFNVFAAETEQSYARDEIQGNGTSGLYPLSFPGIVLNSERVRIEIRDRVQQQRVLETRNLTPYLDYEIDYAAGTLFFREPVYSRDLDFNPVYIVAEYETSAADNRQFNGGGRIGLQLFDDTLELGVSALRDDSSLGRTDLAGADLGWRFADDTELRLETAQSEGSSAGTGRSGEAWLAELEHHSSRYDLLAYSRHQDADFGLNQQNLGNAGQRKTGAQGQLRLGERWSLEAEAYHQQNLVSDAERNAAIGKLRFDGDAGSLSLGAQHIADKLPGDLGTAEEAASSQALVAVSRRLLDGRMDVSLQAETTLDSGQAQSADYPDRYVLGATYALTDSTRVLLAREFTDGSDQDTTATRFGVQVTPWQGARITSTLNQSRTGDFDPRHYSQLGLSQVAALGEQWRLEFGLDSSNTLDGGAPLPSVDSEPGSSPFGQASATAVSDDFVALSAGASWRGDLWGWRGRLESRNSDSSERFGLTSSFLRQARAGVAFSSQLEAFHDASDSGVEGRLASLDLSWAWRPLDSRWSLLNRLEFRYESLFSPASVDTLNSGLFGFDSLTGSDVQSRRLINNFALNRVSSPWDAEERSGNLFQRYTRSQWSLFYGAKYVLDSFDGQEYSGYTDMLGLEVRHDLTPWLDLGLQASALNSWSAGTHSFSFGPQVGFSPVRDGWVTLGWNLSGFRDRDFEAARYTAKGPYLQLRFKFDQNTRFGTGSDSGE